MGPVSGRGSAGVSLPGEGLRPGTPARAAATSEREDHVGRTVGTGADHLGCAGAGPSHDSTATPPEPRSGQGTPPPPGTSPCNGPTCTAHVRWVYTLAGARMPLEPDPHPDGNVIRVRLEDGSIRAKVLTGVELPAQQTAWMPHWRNCPDSPLYRERKTRIGPKCKACEAPMDPDLARRERWTTHPSCDPAGVVPKRERSA